MALFCIMIYKLCSLFLLFFFNDTATTEIYTLSLHDALPIFGHLTTALDLLQTWPETPARARRSEEHTSELQSLRHLVCRLLLEKKKNIRTEMILETNRKRKNKSLKRRSE